MKRTIFVVMAVLLAFTSINGQFFNQSDVELYKKDISAEARNLVKEHMDLTEDQAEIFWPLYDEYDAEIDKLMDENLKVVEEYLINYYDLTDEKAKELVSQAFDIESKKIEIRKKYIEKMYEALPATLVGKFYQIDNRIGLMEQVQRTSKVPLIRKQDLD